MKFAAGPDGGLTGLGENVGEAAPSSVSDVLVEQDQLRRDGNLSRIMVAVAKALRGELPRDYDPIVGMPQKLSQADISMILDFDAGMSLADVAEKHDRHVVYARLIMRHPDAVTLRSLLMGARADKIGDMRSRLEHLAPEALSVKVDIMRSGAPALRDKAASDILNMAGYGERKQLDVKHDISHRIVMPAQAATGLARALEESKRVGVVDYSRFLDAPSGEASDVARLQLGAEPTSAGSLPTAPAEAQEEQSSWVANKWPKQRSA